MRILSRLKTTSYIRSRQWKTDMVISEIEGRSLSYHFVGTEFIWYLLRNQPTPFLSISFIPFLCRNELNSDAMSRFTWPKMWTVLWLFLGVGFEQVFLRVGGMDPCHLMLSAHCTASGWAFPGQWFTLSVLDIKSSINQNLQHVISLKLCTIPLRPQYRPIQASQKRLKLTQAQQRTEPPERKTFRAALSIRWVWTNSRRQLWAIRLVSVRSDSIRVLGKRWLGWTGRDCFASVPKWFRNLRSWNWFLILFLCGISPRTNLANRANRIGYG